MKKLLAISWCFPPAIYPRSIQVSRLLSALSEFEWQSDVVCVDPASLRSGQNLDETLNRPAGGMVKKYPVPSLEDWVLVRGLIRLIPALAYLPDPKWVWKNAATRKCASLSAAKKYTAFISFGQPWTDHLVGLQFKEQTGMPWIAHFSDPWVDSPFVQSSKWVRNRRLEMETAVIKNADAVIFVSKQTADLVMKKYPEAWRKKAQVIPHGFEPVSQPEIEHVESGNTPLILTYTGGFYGQRTPDTLLAAASRLQATPGYKESFQIRFIGSLQKNHQPNLEGLELQNVSFEGPVTHALSQQACREADVLLVIDAPSESPSVFLPSKLIDYLAFDKPILGITPINGSSADLLNQLGCPVVDPLDIAGIADCIRELVDAKRVGKLTLPGYFSTVAAEYQIQNAAHSLDQVLSEITQKFLPAA